MNNSADLIEFGSLSDGEAAFLEFYRSLDDESQTLFFRLAEAMADESVTAEELKEMEATFYSDAAFRDENALIALKETARFAQLLRPAC